MLSMTGQIVMRDVQVDGRGHRAGCRLSDSDVSLEAVNDAEDSE